MKLYFCIFFSCIISLLSAQTSVISRESTRLLNNSNAVKSGGNSNSFFISSFYEKENTVGTQFLFHEARNAVVFKNGKEKLDTFLTNLNFDKVSQKFIFSDDNTNFFYLSNDSVIKILVTSSLRDTLIFLNSPLFKNHLYEKLSKDGYRYSLFKNTYTKFLKSNYSNKGVIESGNNYDEYIDVVEYFIVNNQLKTSKNVKLKTNSFRQLLKLEETKVDLFLKNNTTKIINEQFLIELLYSLD